MKRKTILSLACYVILLSLCTSCIASKTTEVIQVENANIQLVSRDLLGNHLHSNMRAFEIIDGYLHMLLTTNVTPASGTGTGLQYWKKPLDGEKWEVHSFLPDRVVGMANIVSDPYYTNDLFFIFNDRTNEQDRYAIMERFDGTELRRVFELDQSSGQVLNPQAISSQDGYIHIFVPDRTSSGQDGVKWWRMNIETEELERLQDISLPTRGARMYDLIYDNGKIIVPIAVQTQLHLGIIDTEKLTISLQLLDRFTSPDFMPPRSINLFKYEEFGFYLLTYLRPSYFSNRPFTGLVGEVVAMVLDCDTLEILSSTVIGDFSDQAAVTHYMKSEQLNNQMFVVAYTTVAGVHQFHLTGKHGNYVASHLAVWQITEDGKVQLVAEDVTKDTRWDQVLARIDDTTFFFTYNSTTNNNEKWLEVRKLVVEK